MTAYNQILRASDNRFVATDRTFSLNIQNNRTDRFIIVGGTGLARSEDGINWAFQLGNKYGGLAIAFGPDRWLKIGQDYAFGTYAIQFQTSFDGIVWTDIPVPTGGPSAGSIVRIQQLQFDPGTNAWYMVYISGSPTVYPYGGVHTVMKFSADLSTATTLDAAIYTSSTYAQGRSQLCDMTIVGNTFTYAWAAFTDPSNKGYVRQSTDAGLTWNQYQVYPGQSYITSFKYINGIYYYNNFYGDIYTSNDGITWTAYGNFTTNTPLPVGNPTSSSVILGSINGSFMTICRDNVVGVFAPQFNNPTLLPALVGPSGFTPWPSGPYYHKGVTYGSTMVVIGYGTPGLYEGDLGTIVMGNDPFTQVTADFSVRPGFYPDLSGLADIGVRLT